MKTLAAAVTISSILLGTVAQAFAADQDDFQFFQEEAKVVTASKGDQTLANATSVMTVVTAADIERWGARTLYDVMKRVPGFFPTSQASWPVMGSRGLLSDSDDHILLLVDGHAQNSIVGQGFQQQDLAPTMEKVKRIEIIRGPGSVLWGSNAVLGTINVITKDGSDLVDKNKLTVAYGSGDGMKSANYLRGIGIGSTVSGFVSFSYWQSNGYNGSPEFPWGVENDWPSIDQQKEGYELYGKLRFGDDQLLARVLSTSLVYPWDSLGGENGSSLTALKMYMEYQHRSEISDTVKFDSLIYADSLTQQRFPRASSLFQPNAASTSTFVQDQMDAELAFGVETTGKIELFAANHLTVGAKFVRTKIGPNLDTRFNDFTNVAASTSQLWAWQRGMTTTSRLTSRTSRNFTTARRASSSAAATITRASAKIAESSFRGSERSSPSRMA